MSLLLRVALNSNLVHWELASLYQGCSQAKESDTWCCWVLKLPLCSAPWGNSHSIAVLQYTVSTVYALSPTMNNDSDSSPSNGSSKQWSSTLQFSKCMGIIKKVFNALSGYFRVEWKGRLEEWKSNWGWKSPDKVVTKQDYRWNLWEEQYKSMSSRIRRLKNKIDQFPR